MDTEGQELGPYEEVADVLILAAIERAIRHGTEPVWIVTVGEHLGFRHATHHPPPSARPRAPRRTATGALIR